MKYKITIASILSLSIACTSTSSQSHQATLGGPDDEALCGEEICAEGQHCAEIVLPSSSEDDSLPEVILTCVDGDALPGVPEEPGDNPSELPTDEPTDDAGDDLVEEPSDGAGDEPVENPTDEPADGDAPVGNPAA